MGGKQGFVQGEILRVCGELFGGCMEVAVPVEQGVVLALTKSHHRGPFAFPTVTFDQRCCFFIGAG